MSSQDKRARRLIDAIKRADEDTVFRCMYVLEKAKNKENLKCITENDNGLFVSVSSLPETVIAKLSAIFEKE